MAKYNADGDYVLAQRAGNPVTVSTMTRDTAGAVAVDADGNAYICGYFHGTADFGDTITLTAKGDEWDAFVAKLNANDGTFASARPMGGDGDIGQDRANAVTVSAAGVVYVGGSFYGTADFGPDAFTSQGHSDAFLSKLDNEGNFLWTRQFGSGDPNLGDSLTALSLDDSGSVYAAGPFSGSVDFDPTLGGIAILTANTDSQNTFVAKLDSNGTFLSAHHMEREGINSADNPRGIQASADAIYTTGVFLGVGDFDTGTETVLQTSSPSGRLRGKDHSRPRHNFR